MGKVGMGIIISIVIFLGSTSLVFAQNIVPFPFRQNEQAILEKEEVVNQDFFTSGEQVDVKGTVNGDLYAAGGSIVIEGTVNGDVLVAGGQINIPGTVTGNIRTVGGDIHIGGNVGKNITAIGGNIEIEKSAKIVGSAVFAAGNVKVEGPIGGNIVGGVGDLVISNTVNGALYTRVGRLQFENGANVAGNVMYWSNEKATLDTDATISGSINQQVPVDHSKAGRQEAIRSAWASFRVYAFLSMLVIGLLLLRFFPGMLEAGVLTIDQKPWQSLGLGFAKLILEPIIALILIVTIIGLPIGIFLLFAYIMELYFASYIVAYWVGKQVWSKFNKAENRYLAFGIGVVIFIIVTSIPVASGIVRFFSLLFGLGAILLVKWSWYKKTFVKAK